MTSQAAPTPGGSTPGRSTPHGSTQDGSPRVGPNPYAPKQVEPRRGGPFRWVALAVLVAMVVGVMSLLLWWRPSLNPFADDTIDRTGPSVLVSLTDLSEFHPASAYLETVVDLRKDTNRLPDFISGERVLYVGKGDVDAVVDFGELDERRVMVSEDGTSVTIRLPAPIVGRPVLDLENSYIADRDAGIVNRFQGSDLEREAQLKAVAQMSAAATGQGMLLERAEENTTAMLRGLLGSLGYTDITVTYDEDPR